MRKKSISKRILALALAATLFAGCGMQGTTTTNDASEPSAVKGTVTEPAAKKKGSYDIEEKQIPVYVFGADNKIEDAVYFVDGGDIPYISMDTVLNYLEVIAEEENLYTLSCEGDHAIFTKGEGSNTADFDFSADTITFFDYDYFLHLGDGPLVDIGSLGIPYGSSGKLFSTVEELSNDRYGKVMTFDLKPYGIDLVKEGDGYYMPLQTASDLILSYYVCYALYNGECVILTGGLDDQLSEIYHSATGTRSEEYAKFAYNELCFALDYEYGLKEVHGIDSFDEYFFNVGISKALQSTDPLKSDVALHKAITLYLDDLHSQFVSPSYQTDADAFEKEVEGIQGPSNRSFRTTAYKFRDARAAAYPDGIPPYEEVGNTAYITFDEFTDPMPDIDYLSEPTEEELTDTIRLMQYACDRILRENSPIENVVMDLSMNTGGAINEASYVIGTYLGNGDTNVINTMTGAASTAVYKIDTNRDGNFDEQDTLAGKGLNLYCLTSPVSFSCGNLVPNSFMMSPDVTLVGMTSGGGSCSVHTLSTANGSIFNVSSYQRMSVFKNGSYYDIDRGADPDLPIRKYEDFYDRQSLTKYINGIY